MRQATSLLTRMAPLMLAGAMIVAGAQVASAGFNEAGENSFFIPGPGEMTGSPEQAPAATEQPAPAAAMPARPARMHRPAMARMRTHTHTMQAEAARKPTVHRVMHASHTHLEPSRS